MEKIHSTHLKKDLKFEVFLPPNYHQENRNYKVLYANDGQDMEAIKLKKTLENLYQQQAIEPLIVVAVYADKDRTQDYGTACMPDYKQRGSHAHAYSRFMTEELLPFVWKKYRTAYEKAAYMGFSLGGLSAIDIAWNHPDFFDKVGVFSGSFWWRKKAYEDGYDDHNDRIMHNIIRAGQKRNNMRFWLQVGTLDETEDRNNNGIIDAIDDTLDLIGELEAKGYSRSFDIHYELVEGGEHNPQTWGECMPNFLKWAFGK